jgi:hypothetical protein
MKIKATATQCEQLYAARTQPVTQRKATKRQIFQAIKREKGLSNIKLGIRSVVDPFSEQYGVLYDKRSKVDLDDGRQAPKAPVAAPTPVAKATPVVAKTAAPRPAPTPKPAVKAQPVMTPGMSPVKTAKHILEVRVTVDGVRKRYGFASSEKAKAAFIATLK